MSRPRAGGSGMPNHPDSSSRPPQGVDHRPTTGPFAPALSTLATPFGRPSRPSGLCVTISAFRSVSESPDQAHSEKHDGTSPGTFLEMVMLLRMLVGPEKSRIAHKEVERRRLTALK